MRSKAVQRDALREGGFESASTKTGEEAVTLLTGRLLAYCALVTDISLLGRFNGWEVARAAREADPNFPVVYIWGAAAHEWPAQGVPNSIILLPPPSLQLRSLSSLMGARRQNQAGLEVRHDAGIDTPGGR